MTSSSHVEIGHVAATVTNMHSATLTGEHAHAATHAAASLCSEAGHVLLYAPAALQQMIAEAIEVGYATALRDVRDGAFNDKLREWHPALFEE